MNAIPTTPTTPRHPSNGYQVACRDTPSREDTPLKKPASSSCVPKSTRTSNRRGSSSTSRPPLSASKRRLISVLESSNAEEQEIAPPVCKISKHDSSGASSNMKLSSARSNNALESACETIQNNDISSTPTKKNALTNRRRKSNLDSSVNPLTSSARRRSLRIQALTSPLSESHLQRNDGENFIHRSNACFSPKKLYSEEMEDESNVDERPAIVSEKHDNANESQPASNVPSNNVVLSTIESVEYASHSDNTAASNTKRRRSLRLQSKITDSPVKVAPVNPMPNRKVDVAPKATKKSNAAPKSSKRRQSAFYSHSSKKPPLPSSRRIKKSPKIIELTKDGHMELVDALEKFALDAMACAPKETKEVTAFKTSSSCIGGSLEVNADDAFAQIERTVTDSPADDSPAGSDKENSSIDEIDAPNRCAGRRDTFDLSRRRRPILENKAIGEKKDSSTPVDRSPTNASNAKNYSGGSSSSTNSNSSSCGILLPHNNQSICKPNAGEKDIIRKNLFESATCSFEIGGKEDTSGNTVKSVGPAVDDRLQVDKLKDEPHGQTTPELRKSLQNLSTIAIEDGMRSLFPQFKVYNYPCVSARIFAAMSTSMVSEDFNPLLPLVSSLINAEIVSLQNRDEYRDVYFINKKVCFSGFDYSSTVPAVDRVSGSNVDLNSNIEALEKVLKEAQVLPRPVYYLDTAIRCLSEMSSCNETSVTCARTMVGYFPSSRFEKAIKHYLRELQDIKSFLVSQIGTPSQNATHSGHTGVRYRLGDFIGRSVRFHLRQLLNSIPEDMIHLNVMDCEERWGRAVDDWSISSVFNFSLEKIDEFYSSYNQLFEDDVTPTFFSGKASAHAVDLPRKEFKNICSADMEEVLADIKEARSFLFGVRACKFVYNLLQWPGVANHIATAGGWSSVEYIASIFHDLQLYECGDNAHFVLLKNVHELAATLEKVVSRCEETVEVCEEFIHKLRRKLQPRKRETSFCMKGTPTYAIRMCLHGEMEENFPLIREYSAEI